MDKKIKGVKIKRLFCHIHLTWKLTRERKEIILLKGQENRGFKIPVKGTGFCDEQIQNIDIVYPSLGNMDEFRDAAAQIQKGMKFDCSLVLPEFCPGKQFQTQVYGGGIEGIGCLLQLDPKVVVEIERSGNTNQHLGEIGINAPISGFVGVGQGAARYVAPDTHVI